MRKHANTKEEFERSLSRPPEGEHYVLRLFVSGMTPRSTEAYTTIKTLCDELLPGHYELEVVDIYQHPEMAREEQIIAMPTLVKKLPAPLRRFIGNLSNTERLRLGLALRPPDGPNSGPPEKLN